MDFQKMNTRLVSIATIIFLTLLLFYNPLFSGQPLGLDALGHLSKVSYLREYPLASWDMSWYSGTLFLKLYPPLFTYAVAVFPDAFFASNLLCFLSILFSSIGIYLIVKYLTKSEKASLFSSLGFLSVLSLSYYWISAGNLPYFSALWTISFSLYFLEKSIKENKKRDFIFFSVVFSIGILTHIIVGFLIGILMIIRFIFEGLNTRNLGKMILHGIVPVLISSFWLIPFLAYSSSSGGYEGYVPKLMQLFGFKDNIAWGLQAGGVGILAFLFIFSLFFFKKCWKNKLILFYLISLAVLGFLLFGGLGDHYPLGVDAVRFVLPFSILLAIFIGLALNETNLFNNKIFLVSIFLFLILGIFWNYTVINKNFDRFSYYKSDGRYSIMKEILKEKIPLEDKFTNYRFGTSKFIFGETLNYFMPSISQTLGYQDAGMLNAPSYYDMRWHIYLSNDTNGTLYYLDWFAIKYFEFEKSEFEEKFQNNSKFRIIMNFSKGYTFTMYEYLDAKPIISLVDNLNGGNIGDILEFNWERKSPDEITINYNRTDGSDVVLFKEFYHSSWKAKELPSGEKLDIQKAGPGFMAVYPSKESKGVVFYQQKRFLEFLGIFFSLGTIIVLAWILTFSRKPD